jgi:hypothetical protein
VLLWWLALFGWWLVLGTNAGLELIAGACAALFGALLAAALHRQGLLRFRFEARGRCWCGRPRMSGTAGCPPCWRSGRS